MLRLLVAVWLAFQLHVVRGEAPLTLTYAGCCDSYIYTVDEAIPDIGPGGTGGDPTSYTDGGTLPSGITLDGSTGIISGIPDTLGTTTVTISASNADGGPVTISFDMTIIDVPPTGFAYTDPAPSYTVNVAITNNLVDDSSNTGGAITSFELANLSPAFPSGSFGIDALDGTLSGTGTVVTSSTATPVAINMIVRGCNTGGCVDVTLPLIVNDVAPVIDSWSLWSTGYVTDVETAIPYPNVATTSGGDVKAWSVNPTLPTGMSLTSAGQILVSGGIVPVVTATETYVITATNTGGSDSYDMILTVNDVVVAGLLYNSPVSWTLNTVIDTLEPGWDATGGEPVSWGATGLPTGLAIDVSTGFITGEPTGTVEAGQTITVTATNTGGDVTFAITYDVNDEAPAGIEYAVLERTCTKGTACDNPITVASTGGAPDSYSILPAEPAGMSFNTGTGLLDGTPTALVTTTEFTITATNTGGSFSWTFTLEVVDKAPDIAYTDATPEYEVDVLISQNVLINNGGPCTSISVTPDLYNSTGLTMTLQGLISGTPNQLLSGDAIKYPDGNVFTVTCKNTGSTAGVSTTITIVVNAVIPSNLAYYEGVTLVTYYRGQQIANNVPTSDGGDVESYAISNAGTAADTLNAVTGLSFSTVTGEISGTPSVLLAADTFTVTATNTGGSDTVVLNIEVVDIQPDISYNYTSVSYTIGSVIRDNVVVSTGGALVDSYAIALSSAGSCASFVACTGLDFDTATGTISGTPSVLDDLREYTITATNTHQDTVTVSIAILDIAPENLVYTESNIVLTRSTALATTYPGGVAPDSSGGGTVTEYDISPSVPVGLSFDTATGAITGTASNVKALAQYTITASNTGGSTTLIVNITVNDIPPTDLAYSGVTDGAVVYTIGDFVFQSVSSAGGTVTSYAVTAGTLPGGLTLDATGFISGTLNALYPQASVTVTGSNSGGEATFTWDYTVIDLPPSGLTYDVQVAEYTKDTVITTNSPSIASGGDIVTYTSDLTLPDGLELDAATGDITGTPRVLSEETYYIITGTNTGGSTTYTIAITVVDSPPDTLTYGTATLTFYRNVDITQENPSNGGGDIVTYSLPDELLPVGVSLDPSTGAITGTPLNIRDEYDVIVQGTNTGGSTQTTLTIIVLMEPPSNLVYVDNPVSYTIGLNISNNTETHDGGPINEFAINMALPDGLRLNTVTGTIHGTPTTLTSVANYEIEGTNTGGSTTVLVSIEVVDVAPSVTYTYSPYTVYRYETASNPPINVGGDVVTWSITPATCCGLGFSTSSGQFSGTPTELDQAGTVHTISATNTGGTEEFALTIFVVDRPPNFTYPDTEVHFAIDAAVSYSITNFGGQIDLFDIDTPLPNGLNFDTATGKITGTPDTETYPAAPHVITATNSGGTFAYTLNVAVVLDPPTNLFYQSPSLRCIADQLNECLNVANTNGGAVDSFTLVETYPSGLTLPDGMTINATTGQIGGYPTTVTDIATYTIRAENSGGFIDKNITIEIVDDPPVISLTQCCTLVYPRLTPITDNQATLTSGGAVETWSAIPALPLGLEITSTGLITGTPNTTTPVAAYIIRAENSGGQDEITITIEVVAIIPTDLTYAFPSPVYVINDGSEPDNTATYNGDPVVTFSVSPALPAGLEINSTTGVISGTPTEVQSPLATYTVTAENTGGTDTYNIDITVNDIPPASITYTPSVGDYARNSEMVTLPTPTTTGGTVTEYTISPTLPTGMSIALTTGIISGTPTVVSASTIYTVTGTNSGGSVDGTVTLSVSDLAPIDLVYLEQVVTYTKGVAISPANTPSVSSAGGTVVTYSGTLPDGLAMDADGVITGTPTTVTPETDYVITGTNTGGSTTSTLTITIIDQAPLSLTYDSPSATYTLDTLITDNEANNVGGTIVLYRIDIPLPAGLTLDPSTGTISGTPTEVSASTVYTITGNNTGGSTQTFISIIVKDDPPTNLVYSEEDVVYIVDFAITNNTASNSGGTIVTYTVVPDLPAGLRLNSRTGDIHGTPSAVAAETNYIVTGTNSGGSLARLITLTVIDLPPSNMVYRNQTVDYIITYAIEENCVVENDGSAPTIYSIDVALPTGLDLNLETGCITGTPTVVQTATSYVIEGCNTGGCDTTTLSISVSNEGLPTIVYNPGSTEYTVNTTITNNVPVVTLANVVTWGISPALPAGLNFNTSSGVISGTPTEIAVSDLYTISGSNTGGTTQVVLQLAVNDNVPLSLSYANTTVVYTLGVAIDPNIASQTGGAITLYYVPAPVLPDGLEIDASTGVISGTPTALSSEQSYVVIGENSGGSVATTLVITVVDVVPADLSYGGIVTYAFPVDAVITDMTPTTTGGPVTAYSSSPGLPTGLTVDLATGVISGTPTVLSGYTIYTMSAINTGGFATLDLNISIIDGPPVGYTYAVLAPLYTIGIAVSNVASTTGGGAVVVYSVAETLPDGLQLDSVTGEITGTCTGLSPAANYTFKAKNSGGATTVLVEIACVDVIPSNIAYTVPAPVYETNIKITPNNATAEGGPIISWSVSPALPTGLNFNSNNGDITGTGTVIAAATTYTITATNSGGSATYAMLLTVNDAAPLNLTYSDMSPVYTLGSDITPNIPSNNGGVITSYAITPDLFTYTGLTFDTTTGEITGTPTLLLSPVVFTIIGENSGGFSQLDMTIEVQDVAPSSLVYTNTAPLYEVSVEITDNVPTSNGGPVVLYEINPDISETGLTMDPTTGIISGTPLITIPTTVYIVTAYNTGGYASIPLFIAINDVRPSNLQYDVMNATYDRSITIADNTPTSEGGPIASYTIDPELPTGLVFDEYTGIISGTPLVYSANKEYTVVCTNTGGAAQTVITIAVVHGPIAFGLPHGIDAAGVQLFEEYFATFSTITVVPTTNNTLENLLEYDTDVINTDALSAYEAHAKFDFQILAVETADYRASRQYLSEPVVLTSNTEITDFASLEGKTACFGGSTRADGLYMPLVWAIENGLVTASDNGNALDDCESPLIDAAEGFFGTSCAPPTLTDHTGMCSLCPTIYSAGCNVTNVYAFPEGALRGLTEGVCDVAFVRDTTYSDACGESATANDWCLESNQYKGLDDVTNGFGLVPSDVFLVRSSQAMDNFTISELLTALEGISDRADLLAYLHAKGVSRLPDQGHPTASAFDTAYHLSALDSVVDVIPGFDQTMSCVLADGNNDACTVLNADSNCENYDSSAGLTLGEAIKFGYPPNLANDSKAEFERYFANVLQLTGLYVVGVDHNDINSLRLGDVDIVHIDAAAATVGWTVYGFQALATEVTTETPWNTDTEYLATAWVGSGSDIRTFSDLDSQRTCHAGYLDGAGTFNPLMWLNQAGRNVTTGFDITNRHNSLTACDSPISTSMSNFFAASCAPPAHIEGEGICDLCSSTMDCSDDNSYFGSDGALRGLSEKACQAAFIRADTWNLYCDQDPTVKYYSDLEPPDWCLDADAFRSLDDLPDDYFGSAPSDVFMMRGGSLSSEMTTAVYNFIVGLQNEVALLRLLHYKGVRGLDNYGKNAATESHLGDYRASFASSLPGWNPLVNGVNVEHNCTATNSFSEEYWSSQVKKINSAAAPTTGLALLVTAIVTALFL